MHHHLLHNRVLDKAVNEIKRQLVLPYNERLFKYVKIVLDGKDSVKRRNVFSVIGR